jgi:hypothetical protein
VRRLLALAATLALCVVPALADTVSISIGAPSDGDAVIQEIPRPATPAPPTPTPTPRPLAATGGPLVAQGQAGTLAFSVDFDGNTRLYHTALTAMGDRFHGTLSAEGTDTFGAPLGNVTMGDPAHHTTIGQFDDPLSGVVIRNGTFAGVDEHAAGFAGGFDAAVGRRLDGSQLFGLQHESGNTSDTLALLAGGTSSGDVLLRHDVRQTTSWGTIDQELLASTRGTAAGIEARTRGQTFLDATLTRSTGTLPLAEGDLPTSLAIGEHLSNVTTLSAGYAESQGSPARAFVGGAVRLQNTTIAVNASAGIQNLFVSTSSNTGFAQLYASTGAQPVLGLRGSLALRALQFEFDGSRSGGASNGTAQVRTVHGGMNLAAGIDVENGSAHPLFGIVAAVSPSLALETAVIRGSSGRPALRLSIVAGVRKRRPHVVTYPLAIAIAAPAGSAPLRLFVDGAAVSAPHDGRANVALTDGRHDVYAVTSDGAFGSPEREVVAGVDHALALTLIPQRIVYGRVRFAASAGEAPGGTRLQDVHVVLEPSGASVVCDADGNFVFPRAPYDPASVVLVDPATIPAGFAIPGPVAIDAASVLDLPLSPSRGVERTNFR